MGRFERKYMGRGPKDVHAYLINDLIGCPAKGVLTAAGANTWSKNPSGRKGRDLLKEVRTHLIEIARPTMAAMVEGSPAQSGHAGTTTSAL